MPALRFFLRHHPLASAVFALALLAFAALVGRAVAELVYFNDPAHQQQALEPWMTPRYVGLSWQLPPEVVAEIFDLGPPGIGVERRDGRPPTLGDIADTMSLTLPQLEQMLRAAVEARQP